MKKKLRIVVALVFILLPFLLTAQNCLRHPNNGFAPNSGGKTNHTVNDPIGAPLEDGVGILMLVSFAYIAQKTYGFLKNKTQIIS